MMKWMYSIFFLSSMVSICMDIEIQPLAQVLSHKKNIHYRELQKKSLFNYSRHPLAHLPESQQPCSGVFAPTFVLHIPHGRVCSELGWVLVDDFKTVIRELIPQQYLLKEQLIGMYCRKKEEKALKKITGKVAVITRKRYDCYGHFMSDILGRIALLDLYGVSYDYLFCPTSCKYIKECFELLGIPLDRCINPFGITKYIEADELIVPSQAFYRVPCATDPVLDVNSSTHFWPQWLIDWAREKLIPAAYKRVGQLSFAKKIYLSRNDANRRRLLNEDAIFALFEKKGFVKYTPGTMSLAEQIVLFHEAECIVATQGSALTNLMFAQRGVKIVEIYQERVDTAFYNLAHMIGADYRYLATCHVEHAKQQGMSDTYINPEIVKKCIEKHELWL